MSSSQLADAPTLYVFAVAPSCLLALPSAVSPSDGRYDSLAVIRTASAASTRNRATLRSAFRSSPVSIKDWSFGSVNISRHDRDAMVIVSMSAGMSRYRFSVERSGRRYRLYVPQPASIHPDNMIYITVFFI